MASLLGWFKKKADAAYHGFNPFDNGQGWTSVAPPQRPQANNTQRPQAYFNQRQVVRPQFNNVQRSNTPVYNPTGTIKIGATPIIRPNTIGDKMAMTNDVNQQLKTAKFGPLAKPNAGNNFVNQNKPESFNPLTTGAKVAGKQLNDMLVKPVVKTAQYAGNLPNYGRAITSGDQKRIKTEQMKQAKLLSESLPGIVGRMAVQFGSSIPVGNYQDRTITTKNPVVNTMMGGPIPTYETQLKKDIVAGKNPVQALSEQTLNTAMGALAALGIAKGVPGMKADVSVLDPAALADRVVNMPNPLGNLKLGNESGSVRIPGRSEVAPTHNVRGEEHLGTNIEQVKFYRGGGQGQMPKNLSAQDIIDYEQKTLGNNDVVVEPGINPRNFKSDNLMWVTDKAEAAKEYGQVDKVNPENYKVIARDGQGGLLIDTTKNLEKPVIKPSPVLNNIIERVLQNQPAKPEFKRFNVPEKTSANIGKAAVKGNKLPPPGSEAKMGATALESNIQKPNMRQTTNPELKNIGETAVKGTPNAKTKGGLVDFGKSALKKLIEPFKDQGGGGPIPLPKKVKEGIYNLNSKGEKAPQWKDYGPKKGKQYSEDMRAWATGEGKSTKPVGKPKPQKIQPPELAATKPKRNPSASFNNIPKAEKLVSKPKGVKVKTPEVVEEPKTYPKRRLSAQGKADLKAAAKKTGPTSTTGGALSEARSWLTPVTGKAGKVIKNDLRASIGQLELNKGLMHNDTSKNIKFWDKQKPEDHLTFIQHAENGTKQATKELQAQTDNFNKWFEEDYKLAQELDPKTKHVENYFTHNGLWKNTKAAEEFYSKWQKQTLAGSTGALKKRAFPTILDGIRAGLEPRETNPQVLANINRGQLMKAKMAEDFLKQEATKKMNDTDVQAVLDRYLSRGFKDSNIYRSGRQIANTMNQAQLSLSGFHVGGTAINSVVSQGASALNKLLTGHPIKAAADVVTAPVAPIKNIYVGSKMIKNFKKGNITPDIQNVVEGGGRMGMTTNYKATGIAQSIKDVKTGTVKGIAKGIAAAPLRVLSTAAKPVMEWWVPRLKLGATRDLMNTKLASLGKGATKDEIRAAKAEVIDSIDNRFGQLVQDNLFWNEHLKDIMHVAMRSPGWNIGTVRELGGGAADMFKPSTYVGLAKGQGLSSRTAYTASLTAGVAMMGATIQFALTGKMPSEMKDYFYPKTGKTDANGNDERVALPTYMKDVFAFTDNPIQTAKNKANPFITEAFQLASNKNYFGDMIRNPQDSLGTQAKQVGGFLAKSNIPFTLQSSNKRVDKTPATTAESFFGMSVAPGYITKSGFQQKVESALNQKVGTTASTPEEQALITAKSEAKKAAAKGDNSKIQELLKSGKITAKQADNLKSSSANTSLQNTFSYLMKVDAAKAGELIKHASNADLAKLNMNDVKKSQDAYVLSQVKAKQTSPTTVQTGTSTSDITALPSGQYSADIGGTNKTFKNKADAQLAIDFQNFQDSGKAYEEHGDWIFRMNDTGTASKITKTKFQYDLNTARLTQLKNQDDVEGWIAVAKDQMASIQKQMSDPNVDPLDSIKLQNDYVAIKKNLDKYISYGGSFTKGKAGSKGKKGSKAAVAIKPISTKITRPRGVSIRKPAAYKGKKVVTRKIAVDRLPSNYLSKKLG